LQNVVNSFVAEAEREKNKNKNGLDSVFPQSVGSVRTAKSQKLRLE
jgi:hypothetical protein